MTDTPISSQVYKSRDQIRNQLITLMREYLELENVDLTKSSFLSFVINALSTLTSNTLFYQISAYREFFLTKAQLPESIYNLATFLGYTPQNAISAKVNVLFTIPFGFEDVLTSFFIPEGFSVTAENNILFKTYYSTQIEVTNNSQVKITVREGNRTYILPVTIDTSDFLFILPLRQFSTSQQEFQIDEDLKQYQFVTIDVPFLGQISDKIIQIKPPDSSAYELYTEIPSLFLMDASTKGYVSTRTNRGITLQFGNGLIGYQPKAGSTVSVNLSLTEGSGGNVIAGSLRSGDRIYNTTNTGVTENVRYSLTNTEPAFNGADEESLEKIRSNAITNISSLNRIITENDFQNSNIIIKDSPLGANSLPVLKRSDIKINEISLFSTIYFGNDLVPTRNVYETFYFAPEEEKIIPRYTIIEFDNIEYYTVFDITIDPLNASASYTYEMYEINQIPTLVTNYGTVYDLYTDNLLVTRSGNSVTFNLTYHSTEATSHLTSCTLQMGNMPEQYSLINDSTSFIITFADYTLIPKGNISYYFTITHPDDITQIAQYSCQFILRQDLSDFAISNVTHPDVFTFINNEPDEDQYNLEDSTAFVVYDIPVVLRSYYDNIDQRVFELNVMQNLLKTLSFKDYRMITDFINFKFSNTTGILRNMQLNPVDFANVNDIVCVPPDELLDGDSFIIKNGREIFEGYDNCIATVAIDGTTSVWTYIEPKTNQMVFIESKNYKYIYCDHGWVMPQYNIPLHISLDIFKDSSYSGSLTTLTNNIRETLVSAFSDKFGINYAIYRSQIIDIIQSIEGVKYCRLLEPKSSIFFNFDINDFTQEELLQYSPEFVYFTEDNISIRIL